MSSSAPTPSSPAARPEPCGAFTLSNFKNSPIKLNTSVFLSSIEEGYLRLLCENLEAEKIVPLLKANPQIINATHKNLALDFFYNYIFKANQNPLSEIEKEKITVIFNSLINFYQKTDFKHTRFFSIQSPSRPLPGLLNILEKCFVNIENESNFVFCQDLLMPFMQINQDFISKLCLNYLNLGAMPSSIEIKNAQNKILTAFDRIKERSSITDFLDHHLLAHIFLINGNFIKKNPAYDEAALFELLPKLISHHGFGRKIEEKVSKAGSTGMCLLALCIVRSKSEEALNFLLPYVHYDYQKTKNDIAEYYRNHYGYQWTPAANFFTSMGPGDCQAIVDKYFLSHYTPSAKAGKTIKI